MNEKPLYEGSFAVIGGNFDHAGEVASNIKAILKQMGLSSDIVRKVSLVAYESEINIVSYAKKGMIRLRVVPDSVMIETIDEGPGITDINLAMQPGYSTATDKIREMGFGAGMGLCNIKSFSDIFQISSEMGKGTYLKMIIKTNGYS
ncbi:MAG: ATP-binding protein [Deltaproteobacteria bacterium]